MSLSSLRLCACNVSYETRVFLTSDTDIAIILSSNVEKLGNNHLWYDFAVYYNNSCKYIKATEFAKTMKIIKALSGIYAFTVPEMTIPQHFSEKEK